MRVLAFEVKTLTSDNESSNTHTGRSASRDGQFMLLELLINHFPFCTRPYGHDPVIRGQDNIIERAQVYQNTRVNAPETWIGGMTS
jgi:hypothetical protein